MGVKPEGQAAFERETGLAVAILSVSSGRLDMRTSREQVVVFQSAAQVEKALEWIRGLLSTNPYWTFVTASKCVLVVMGSEVIKGCLR